LTIWQAVQPQLNWCNHWDNEGHDLGVCCINVTELYSGVPERKRLVAAEFVDSLDYYDVTPDIAKLAGAYRFDFARKGITLSQQAIA
jgi:predicted nucleic acid-binding protein